MSIHLQYIDSTNFTFVLIIDYARTGIKKMIGTQREVEARKKDGTLFPCILGLSELGWNGDGKHYAGFIRDVTLQKSLLIAEAEREASDNLLHNILPKHIAQRLKQDPSNIADHFDNTTILFADIVGFTDRTSTMSPREGTCFECSTYVVLPPTPKSIDLLYRLLAKLSIC